MMMTHAVELRFFSMIFFVILALFFESAIAKIDNHDEGIRDTEIFPRIFLQLLSCGQFGKLIKSDGEKWTWKVAKRSMKQFAKGYSTNDTVHGLTLRCSKQRSRTF